MRTLRFCTIVLLTAMLVSSAVAQFSQNRWHTPAFSNPPASNMDSMAIPIRQSTSVGWALWGGFNETPSPWISPASNGGWFFVWDATPSGDRGVYAGRIRANGDTAWFRTVNNGSNRQEDEVVMATNDGGAIIAWVDYREGPYYFQGDSTHYIGDGGGSIMVQKLDSNGTRLWNVTSASDTINAVPVCMVFGYQNDIHLIPDDAGGCYLFWEDSRNYLGEDIYGTRILANGSLAPGYRINGNPIVVASGNQPVYDEYSVTTDGRNGAWVAWTDNRRLVPDIFIQQLRADGTTRWDSTGHPFDTTAGDKNKVKIVSDGRSGAFLVWRNNNHVVDLLMQRIDSTGQRRWSPDTSYYYFAGDSQRVMIDTVGVPIGKWDNEQTNPRIISSGQDSCIVSWEDFRNDPSGITNEDIYAQKISGNTTMIRSWGTNAVPVCIQPDHQRESRLSSDGQGGCVVTWEDERGGAYAPNQDVYAQRVNAGGIVQWTTNGTPVAAFDRDQCVPNCALSSGHVLFMWSDGRFGSDPIYRTVWDLSGNAVGTMPLHGVKTVDDIGGNTYKNVIVKQGTNRIINFWIDSRYSSYGSRIYYAQNAISDGANLTPGINGLPLTLDSINYIIQDCPVNFSNPIVVATPDSGAIIIYRSITGSSSPGQVTTLRAQKISYNGVRMWGDFGVEVCAQDDGFEYFTGVSDGSGGVYFAYVFVGSPPDYYNEIHFQHINASGVCQYLPTGINVSPGSEQSWASLVMSGGNLYLGYIEVYDEIYNLSRVRLLKMNSDGTVNWSRIVVTGYDSSGTHGPKGIRLQLKLIPATNGSVVAYWKEFRFEVAGGSGGQIYAQKIDSSGNFLWGSTGKRLAASIEDESNAVGINVGNTYWFCWQDERGIGFSSLYLQHLNDNGQFLLDSLGQQLRANVQAQTDPLLVPDANTGVYVAYTQWFIQANPFPPPDTLGSGALVATHLASDGSIVHPEIWQPNTPEELAYIVKTKWPDFLPQGVPVEGGAIITWEDARATSPDEMSDLYIQRIADNFVSVKEVAAPLPLTFTLSQNYPNPFNPTTTFKFTLPRTDKVKIAIYDVTGREVARLLDAVKMAGTYEVHWSGKNAGGKEVASGMYFYRIETSLGTITKKMTMLK